MHIPLWLTETTDQALSDRKNAAQEPYQALARFSLRFYHLARVFLLMFLSEQYFLLNKLGFPQATLFLAALYLLVHLRTCFVAYRLSEHIIQKHTEKLQLRLLTYFETVNTGISATLFVLLTSAFFIAFAFYISADTYNILKIGILIINILSCIFLYISNELPSIVVIFLSSSNYQKKKDDKKIKQQQVAPI